MICMRRVSGDQVRDGESEFITSFSTATGELSAC